MTTHSSILAWRIPWIEEPGGLPSTGLQSWTQLSSMCSVTGTACSAEKTPMSGMDKILLFAFCPSRRGRA